MSPARVIVLPNGRAVTLGAYAQAWRAVATMPPEARVSPGQWLHFETDAETVLRDMRGGLHDRINRHLSWFRRGRKWHWAWQRDVARIAWNLNGRRIVTRVREVPPEYRGRLAHRLHDDGGAA